MLSILEDPLAWDLGSTPMERPNIQFASIFYIDMQNLLWVAGLAWHSGTCLWKCRHDAARRCKVNLTTLAGYHSTGPPLGTIQQLVGSIVDCGLGSETTIALKTSRLYAPKSLGYRCPGAQRLEWDVVFEIWAKNTVPKKHLVWVRSNDCEILNEITNEHTSLLQCEFQYSRSPLRTNICGVRSWILGK